jgi:hypothetical protein
VENAGYNQLPSWLCQATWGRASESLEAVAIGLASPAAFRQLIRQNCAILISRAILFQAILRLMMHIIKKRVPKLQVEKHVAIKY